MTEKVLGQINDWTTITARMQSCHVTQIVDRAMGKSSLITNSDRDDEIKRTKNRRDDLKDIMNVVSYGVGMPANFTAEYEDMRGKRPLLITYKAVEEKWIEDGDIEDAALNDTPLRDQLPYAIEHFQNIRGKDRYKETSAVVVVGRPQPGVRALERLARAMFFDDHEPIVGIIEDGGGRVNYPEREEFIQGRDSYRYAVSVPYHPDERADGILRSIREAEISQGLSRARLIHRQAQNPCAVILVTNLPIEGVIVDAVTTWRSLVPSADLKALTRGFVSEAVVDNAAAWPEDYSAGAAYVKKHRENSAAASSANANVFNADVEHTNVYFEILQVFLHTSIRECKNEKKFTNSDSRYTQDCKFFSYAEISYKMRAGNRYMKRTGLVRVDKHDKDDHVISKVYNILPNAVYVSIVGYSVNKNVCDKTFDNVSKGGRGGECYLEDCSEDSSLIEEIKKEAFPQETPIEEIPSNSENGSVREGLLGEPTQSDLEEISSSDILLESKEEELPLAIPVVEESFKPKDGYDVGELNVEDEFDENYVDYNLPYAYSKVNVYERAIVSVYRPFKQPPKNGASAGGRPL